MTTAGGNAVQEGNGGSMAAEAGAAETPMRSVEELPFEAAMVELERIVRQLETGELGLDAALGLYERGIALVRRCSAQLDSAEQRLQVLTIDASGEPQLRPEGALEG